MVVPTEDAAITSGKLNPADLVFPKCPFARAHKLTSSMHDYHFLDLTDCFIANACRKT